MKIIKRNGSEAVFDISKIIAAVTKANNVVASNQRLTKEQITAIADDVAQECQSRNHAMNVEEIQDLVEDAIMQTKAYEVARKYICRACAVPITPPTTAFCPSSSATMRKSSRKTPIKIRPSTAFSAIIWPARSART